jgi:uncharacterized FlaG/YvyC family protein
MKIQSLIPNFGYREVTKKKEATLDDQRQQKKEESPRDSNEKESEEKEFSFESVNEELTHFAEENASLLAGISASVNGTGPGLRVTLKDGKGAVVREISGEEFMQMREASKVTGRGHLIDKKL